MNLLKIKQHILSALEEDIQTGDFSSLASVEENQIVKAKVIAKQEGILCGVDIFRLVFSLVGDNENIIFNSYAKDGDNVSNGQRILSIQAKARVVLAAERTALNYLQLMSGIATKTRQYVDALQGMHTKLLDTRKTTPTLRELEKYAVKVGGAVNHRFGLYDMIMLKDNHIDFAGGIRQAIEKTNNFLKSNNLNLKIEIEVRNFQELEEVLSVGSIDRIMLDNFSPEDLKQAVKIINHRYETEASGGITLQNLKDYASSKVDFISVGALTHHISALDFSLVCDK